ncbi:unnamed protein product, partial [marine sediment metagenome]
KLLLPAQQTEGRFRVPAIDFAGRSDDSVAILAGSSQVGISASSDFEVVPELSDAEAILEIAIDQFLRSAAALLSEDKSGSGSPRPRFAYQFDEPMDFSFRLTSLTPKRAVWQYQVGEVGAHSLNWKLAAEIETTEAPAFRHSLRVSPQLEIESVSVTEDKANRLVRVSRLGDRLELYLSHPTTGSQNIELSGTMSLRQSREFRLPLIDVIDAVAEESSLSLYHDGDVVVASTAFDSLAKIERGSETDPDQATHVFFGQFRLPPDTQQLAISVHPRDDKVDTVTLIDGQEDGRWLVTTGLRFREFAQARSQFRLRIPREYADHYHLRAGDAESKGEFRP